MYDARDKHLRNAFFFFVVLRSLCDVCICVCEVVSVTTVVVVYDVVSLSQLWRSAPRVYMCIKGSRLLLLTVLSVHSFMRSRRDVNVRFAASVHRNLMSIMAFRRFPCAVAGSPSMCRKVVISHACFAGVSSEDWDREITLFSRRCVVRFLASMCLGYC